MCTSEIISIPCFWPGMSPYGDWSENDISGLREGIALHGRLWTKVSRQVSGKTPAQCKTFFQEYQTDSRLKLGSTLEEHLKSKVHTEIVNHHYMLLHAIALKSDYNLVY